MTRFARHRMKKILGLLSDRRVDELGDGFERWREGADAVFKDEEREAKKLERWEITIEATTTSSPNSNSLRLLFAASKHW